MDFKIEPSGHLRNLVQLLQERLDRKDLYFGFNEPQLTAIIPVAAYWLSAAFYEVLDYFDAFPKYRQLPSEEERSRNVPTRSHVVKHVLFLHVFQLLMGFAVDYFGVGDVGAQTTAWWGGIIWSYYPKHTPGLWDVSTLLPKITTLSLYISYLLARQLLALAVIDTWVFWLHYGMHKIPWLYRNVHSIHHELYTPYAFGAMYNSFFEGFFVDIVGCVISQALIGLSNWEAIVLFTFATVKIVDDHSGYQLPWSPFVIFGRLTGSNGIYHGIHHQKWGMKYNMENYFTFWDTIIKTGYPGERVLHFPPTQAEIGSWSSQRRTRYLATLKEDKGL